MTTVRSMKFSEWFTDQPTAQKSEIQRAPELIHMGLQVLNGSCQYAVKVIS